MKRTLLLVFLSIFVCAVLTSCRDGGEGGKVSAAGSNGKGEDADGSYTGASDSAGELEETDADETEHSEASDLTGVTGQIGDFTVKNGELVEYSGSDKEPVIPAGGVKIGSKAAADSIEKITLGGDVKQIDPEAFFGLPSLSEVYADGGNSSFKSEKTEDEPYPTSFLYGTDDEIIFYFSRTGEIWDDIYDKLPAPYMKEENAVTFVCGNAVLDLFYPSKTPEGEENFAFFCRSVKYDGNTVGFDKPVPFGIEMMGTQIFETVHGELVFETNCYYNTADIYYVTKDTPKAIELHGLSDRTVSFYLDDKKELRYHAIRTGFDILDQTMGGDALSVVTGRDDYYGEDGRVSVENGEFRLERENLYTISDYFRMNGTDIDTAFRELGFDEDYDSLESLFEANKKKTGLSD